MLCITKVFIPLLKGERYLDTLCWTRFLQTTSVQCKKKKFYNQYMKEYQPRINYDYIEDYLTDIHKKSIFDTEKDVDFEQQLLREAKRRRKAYNYARNYKTTSKEFADVFGDSKFNFSQEQIQHIQFLHCEDPQWWTKSNLAVSFGVKPEVIGKVLKMKIKPNSSEESCESRNYSRAKSNEHALTLFSAQDLLTASDNLVETPTTDTKIDEIEENRWFRSFTKTKHEQEYFEIDDLDDVRDAVEEQALHDEHHEIFDYSDDELDYDDEKDDGEAVNSDLEKHETLSADHQDFEDVNDDHEHDVKNYKAINGDFKNFSPTSNINDNVDEINFIEPQIVTDDNKTFYDEDGRFLYKVV